MAKQASKKATPGVLASALINEGRKESVVAANEPFTEHSQETRLVHLNRAQVTIAFACFRKDIPRGVKIHSACGGKSLYVKDTADQGLRFDLKNFLARASVDEVCVINNNGHCLAYLNCTVGPNKKGLDFWGKNRGNKCYDAFIHDLVGCTWGKMTIGDSPNKTLVTLRNYSYDDRKEVIRFDIKNN